MEVHRHTRAHNIYENGKWNFGGRMPSGVIIIYDLTVRWYRCSSLYVFSVSCWLSTVPFSHYDMVELLLRTFSPLTRDNVYCMYFLAWLCVRRLCSVCVHRAQPMNATSAALREGTGECAERMSSTHIFGRSKVMTRWWSVPRLRTRVPTADSARWRRTGGKKIKSKLCHIYLGWAAVATASRKSFRVRVTERNEHVRNRISGAVGRWRVAKTKAHDGFACVRDHQWIVTKKSKSSPSINQQLLLLCLKFNL